MPNFKTKPLVSIGVPTYNRPEELLRCINIIKGQTHKNLQVIICDNGGSINVETLAIIGNDHRFELIENIENIGVLRNTAKVAQTAVGKYFCWFSDDDWHAAEFIETMVDGLEQNSDYQFAFANFSERTADGDVAAPLRNNLSRNMTYMASQNGLFRLAMFYLDDGSYGKCNAFYGLFRNTQIKKLDFERLSVNFSNLGMDNYIVYAFLKLGPALIIHDKLISLQCKNVKFYPITTPLTTAGKFFNFIKFCIMDLVQIISLSDELFLKLIILLLVPLKLLSNIFRRLTTKYRKKMFMRGKNWDTYQDLLFGDQHRQLDLPDVTLVCVATKNVERSVLALKYSQKAIKFSDVQLFSHYGPQNIGSLTYHKISKFKSVEEWGKFIVYDLHKYINTEFIVLVHDDGFIVNSSKWVDEFKEYDYIGAPWPIPEDNFSYRTDTGELVRVGNSVSLRSLRLLKLPSKLKLDWKRFHGFLHEDGFLNVQYRDILKEHGVVYPNYELAAKFGREACDSGDEPFTFHKWKGKNIQYPSFELIE